MRESMQTMQIDLPRHHDAITEYLVSCTSGSKIIRNKANFLVRNIMTGIQKQEADRTDNEKEAITAVFSGIDKANAVRQASFSKKVQQAGRIAANWSVMYANTHMRRAFDAKDMAYPTADKWLLNYYQLYAVLKYEYPDVYYSCACKSHVNQKAIKKVSEAWTGYLAALQGYMVNPSLYTGRPKIPGYIKTQETTAQFTNQVSKVFVKDEKMYISFSSLEESLCIGTPRFVPDRYVKCEVKPINGILRLLITYKNSNKEPVLKKDASRFLGIDPGLDNFLSVANNIGMTPFILDGAWIKSQNQWFNKRRTKLISSLTAGSDSSHSKKNSRNLSALSLKRERSFRDYFYKAAHYIFTVAKNNQIDAIIIGNNKGQKTSIHLGRQTNQSFVQIPFATFRGILKNMSWNYGIPVIEREESYTSAASLLDGDFIPTYGKDDDNATFSGKRVKRGLYKSKDGTFLNADINGAANIIRKEFPAAFENMELSFLCTTVYKITAEALLGIERQNTKKVPFRKRKSTLSQYRHDMRKERRFALIQAHDAFKSNWFYSTEPDGTKTKTRNPKYPPAV